MKEHAPDEHRRAGWYEIRIKGHLDDHWADWFEGLTITREPNGETRLTGAVVDQPALHSLLRKVRDLGVTLVAVSQLDTHEAAEPDASADTVP